MKILIIGSCRNNDFECKARTDIEIAERIGQELAQRNHSIITGGAGGLQGKLAETYKQCSGPKWTAFYAEGEESDPNARPLSNRMPDDPILTHMAYPIRNAHYTSQCDGVIALSGKILTLGEIISASKGYGKPVFQVKMGNNIDIIRKLSELETVVIYSNINTGIDYLEGKGRIK